MPHGCPTIQGQFATNPVDPDPRGFSLILVGWIRIRIRIGNADPDHVGKYGPKKAPKKRRIVLF
jgi:hypothetical protein